MKDFNFSIHTNITRAMYQYNKIAPKPKFTPLDAMILCLTKSFYESKTQFYMSNKEMAENLIVNPSTIQASVDKLVAFGLLSKEVINKTGMHPKRILAYQPSAVSSLFQYKED